MAILEPPPNKSAHPVHPVPVNWRISDHCGDSGECVEVGRLSSAAIAVRDNTDPAAQLHLTPMEWAAFRANIKRGLYDPPQAPPV